MDNKMQDIELDLDGDDLAHDATEAVHRLRDKLGDPVDDDDGKDDGAERGSSAPTSLPSATSSQ